MLLLGLDLGNWNVKTSMGDIFPSRYTTIENILGANADVLEYEGTKYYIGEGRLENDYDKSSKQTNVILFLYALAIQSDNHFKVVVGLPTLTYKANRDKFKEKLLSNKIHDVYINRKHKRIIIEDLIVFPEGAGAYYSINNRPKNSIIVDIGGGTTNIVQFKAGKLDKGTTVGAGAIELYNRIREHLNSTHTLKLQLEDVEGIMKEGLIVDGQQIDFKFMRDIVDKFVDELMNELRNFDIRTSKVYLTGGGSKLLKGTLSKKIVGLEVIEDYLFSNAIGFKNVGVSKWRD